MSDELMAAIAIFSIVCLLLVALLVSIEDKPRK